MENNRLIASILKALEEMYMNSNDLLMKLKMNCVAFEQKTFLMTLSALQVKNLILSNWISDKNGQKVKYYYLSRHGLKYIQQNN
jgi:hypothetical protein